MKIATLHSAVLLAASAVSASSAIAVYEFPAKNSAAVPPVLVQNSVLYLADKFGAGEHYALGHKDDAGDIVDLMHGKSNDASARPDLLVVLKGVDAPAHLHAGAQPSFEILAGSHKQAHALVKTLFKKLPKQVAHALNASHVAHVTDEIRMVSADSTQGREVARLFRLFNQELPQAWAALVDRKPETHLGTAGAAGAANGAGQQVLDVSAGLKLVNDKLYISEMMQMVKFAAGAPAPGFVVANLDSLHSIGLRIGYDSKTYHVAKGALLESILALQSHFDITVVAVGTDHKLASDTPQLRKRSAELDGAFSTFGKRGAVAAKACFADQDACVSATTGCSGHGACTQVQELCWQCVCKATYDKKTSKTTRWAGGDCGKKDIAAQAHLLLWTSVALLATLVGGIKLLFGVGSGELPGVLQAATIDTSR